MTWRSWSLCLLLATLPGQVSASELYPPSASGWGPGSGPGRFISRWAEGRPPAPRPVLTGDLRLQQVHYGQANFDPRTRYGQTWVRGIIGADWRPHPGVQVFAELGTGQVEGRRDTASGNFQNALSLQQALVHLSHESAGSATAHRLGLILGRQTFSDGPRQIISLADGPNLHRSWNGVRGYVLTPHWRISLAHFAATQMGRQGFDESINEEERLTAITGSLRINIVEKTPSLYVEPFWFDTRLPRLRIGQHWGRDHRQTYGLRVRGDSDGVKWDATLARQQGHTGH